MIRLRVALLLAAGSTALMAAESAPSSAIVPAPPAPFADYRSEKPGAAHEIAAGDLPEPYATRSATNWPRLIDRPKNAWPQAPAGFKVELFVSGFNEPRKILTAPNGDAFLVESSGGR